MEERTAYERQISSRGEGPDEILKSCNLFAALPSSTSPAWACMASHSACLPSRLLQHVSLVRMAKKNLPLGHADRHATRRGRQQIVKVVVLHAENTAVKIAHTVSRRGWVVASCPVMYVCMYVCMYKYSYVHTSYSVIRKLCALRKSKRVRRDGSARASK